MEDTRGHPNGPASAIQDSQPLDPAVDTIVFRLLDIPLEIVTQVFESLVPAPLPTGTRLPLSTDILASRKTLFNLCLASKLCWEITMPLLYRNVILTDHIQTAQLAKTLAAHEDRYAWMRSLAALVALAYQESSKQDDREILEETKSWLSTYKPQSRDRIVLRTIKQAKTIIRQLFNTFDRHDFDRGRCFFYHRLFRIIMYMGTRIEDLLITAPCSRMSSNNTIHEGFSYAELHDMTSGQDPNKIYLGTGFDGTCKALRRIKHQSDPDPRFRATFEPDPMALEFFKCQSWEFLRDDGYWSSLLSSWRPFTDQQPRFFDVFSHVTELRLYESETHPAWLRKMLSHTKQLKILHYTTNATNWNSKSPTIGLNAEDADATLQQAVEEVEDTLADLRLGWAPWGVDLTEEDQAAVAPHRVDVSRFPRLKRIDIDQAFLDLDEHDENDTD